MKIKEIDRTAFVAWSPAEQFPIYLAAGTAAQQLDSSFNTNSHLELYSFDVNRSGIDLPVSAAIPCESRFHKLVWGCHGMSSSEPKGGCGHVSGVIVGGFDEGVMKVYDANKILEKHENSLVLTKNKHAGAVRALDFNSFRSYLIASGAAESEIFIWDLNNPKTPMSPGAKAQPLEDVTCLAWNKQVEHILASTFSTRCVVWDLRKNEPIIKLADTASKIKYKVVEWHPTTATQMCLASEDDSNPVIQLWDLRYATAPLKILQGHEKGVLSLAWCERDPDLLLSCGKDNHIYCWNPNMPYAGYELVCDIQTSSQWEFDVSFSPRNPLVISSSSFDGRVNIFSLNGGSQQPVSSSKLADSFPGMSMDLSHTPVPSQKPAPVNLRDAPKWLKRPCGASFAFGGKLIAFSNVKAQSGDAPEKRLVTISQVVTLPELIAKSQKLENALRNGTLVEFCEEKAFLSKDRSESKIWQFLQASFTKNPNEAYLAMLGFDSSELQEKLGKIAAKFSSESADSITDGFVSLGRGMTGFNNHLFPSENATNAMFFDNISQSSTRSVTPEPGKQFAIPTDESTEGLLNQAILSGNIEYAVDMCLKENRWADALILASMGGPDLIKKAQLKYFHKCENETSNMIRAVVTRDLKRLMERCELEYWAQALACALNYANETEFPILAEILGRRLEASKNEDLKKNAILCFICCGDMNRLMEGWATGCEEINTPDGLQDLIEQIMLLRKASEMRGKVSAVTSKVLASKLVQYATLLASQGCLESALNYVKDTNEPSMVVLRESLEFSLGLARPSSTRSIFQVRSRQASESSTSGRHPPLTKRPSYPSVPPPVAPPSGSYDGRRMSSHLDDPNIASLTGPPLPPPVHPVLPASNYSYAPTNYNNPTEVVQPVAPPPSNFYNPLNVNVNNPPNWNATSTSNQPSPYTSAPPVPQPVNTSPGRVASYFNPNDVAKDVMSPSRAGTFFNPNDTTKLMNPAVNYGRQTYTPAPPTALPPPSTSMPLPASVAPPATAWNDPPMLKGNVMTKPKRPVHAPLNPITHPIFGTAPPEQQLQQHQLPPVPPAGGMGYGYNYNSNIRR